MHDEINAAYNRIAGRFPAEWPVEILAQANVGRRKTFSMSSGQNFAPIQMIESTNTLDFSLHVTAGGVDYVEIDVDLDEIERAAEAIIEQIAAADMADPQKSRRGLDRLAEAVAVESAPVASETGRAA